MSTFGEFETDKQTWKEKVEAFPPNEDPAVESAMMNAADMGLNEDDDSETFWREVFYQVEMSR